MQTYVNEEKNIKIQAAEIKIHPHVSFGKNINVSVRGTFEIGSWSRLGDNTNIKGNNIRFGQHLYNSAGLNIGGGGFQHPRANFSIGDRCTIHNNFINVCEPVTIGDDVGLSPDTSILTHGYWLSVNEGQPAIFSGVTIGNRVIVGYRSLIMMGIQIADDCIVGAGSTISRSLKEKGIYAGVPAKFIRSYGPLPQEQRVQKMEEMLASYAEVAKYHGLNPNLKLDYPWIHLNDTFKVNVETFAYEGHEDINSDDFRDYIRKWGIRIYTERPFVNAYKVDGKAL